MHDDQKYIDALVYRDDALVDEIYNKFAPECKRFIIKNGGSQNEAYNIFQEILKVVSLRHKSKPIELVVPFGEYLQSVYKNLWLDKNINKRQHDDQKYLEALVNRNEALVEEIYQNHAPECKRFVLRNGGTVDDAYDIFQEALIAVSLRHQSKPIELLVPFGGYLYRVYKNLWINELRMRNKDQSINIIDTENIKDPFFSLEQNKELQFIILKDSFNELKRDCKELLGMRMIDMSAKEIAEELDIEPNNVDQKMYTCRERLRKCCENHPLYKQL